MTSAPLPVATTVGARTALAFWLDVLLLLLFLLEESPRITGVAAHEVLGLVIAVPLVLHLLLSWQWIVAKARLLRRGSLRTRFNYAVNATLFLAMVIVIVSGALVSRVALPAAGIGTINDAEWFETHDFWSNVLFVTIGLHLAMNWGWVTAVWQRHAFTREEAEANEEDVENGGSRRSSLRDG